MNFSQLKAILLARRWLWATVFFTTVLVTTLLSFLLPKTYTATTSIVVSSKTVDPITGNTLPANMLPGYMATQIDIIQSENVALRVVDKLGLANNPTAKAQFEKATNGKGDIRHWFAEQFLQNLDVKPSRESTVVELIYKGADPDFAATLANAFAEAYIETNLQLRTEPAKRTAQFFDQQMKNLRLNVEKAQERLSSYQKEQGIASTDERLDVETARLNELSSQLVMAQAQTYDSNSRQNQIKRDGAGVSPEIMSSPLIQGLKSQLTQAEARFNDVQHRLGANHPQYQAALADVENIRHMIAVEAGKTSSSVGQTAKISQQKESELRSALAAQKDRVLKLKTQHDEIAVLTHDVEAAQRIYDNALMRLGQTNMESQSGHTDIAILNPATPPLKHSSPKITLNILLSFFLGGMLGIGFAVAAELMDRRVRTTEDIAQLLNVPVLMELPQIGMDSFRALKKMIDKKTWRRSPRNLANLATR